MLDQNGVNIPTQQSASAQGEEAALASRQPQQQAAGSSAMATPFPLLRPPIGMALIEKQNQLAKMQFVWEMTATDTIRIRHMDLPGGEKLLVALPASEYLKMGDKGTGWFGKKAGHYVFQNLQNECCAVQIVAGPPQTVSIGKVYQFHDPKLKNLEGKQWVIHGCFLEISRKNAAIIIRVPYFFSPPRHGDYWKFWDVGHGVFGNHPSDSPIVNIFYNPTQDSLPKYWLGLNSPFQPNVGPIALPVGIPPLGVGNTLPAVQDILSSFGLSSAMPVSPVQPVAAAASSFAIPIMPAQPVVAASSSSEMQATAAQSIANVASSASRPPARANSSFSAIEIDQSAEPLVNKPAPFAFHWTVEENIFKTFANRGSNLLSTLALPNHAFDLRKGGGWCIDGYYILQQRERGEQLYYGFDDTAPQKIDKFTNPNHLQRFFHLSKRKGNAWNIRGFFFCYTQDNRPVSIKLPFFCNHGLSGPFWEIKEPGHLCLTLHNGDVIEILPKNGHRLRTVKLTKNPVPQPEVGASIQVVVASANSQATQEIEQQVTVSNVATQPEHAQSLMNMATVLMGMHIPIPQSGPVLPPPVQHLHAKDRDEFQTELQFEWTRLADGQVEIWHPFRLQRSFIFLPPNDYLQAGEKGIGWFASRGSFIFRNPHREYCYVEIFADLSVQVSPMLRLYDPALVGQQGNYWQITDSFAQFLTHDGRRLLMKLPFGSKTFEGKYWCFPKLGELILGDKEKDQNTRFLHIEHTSPDSSVKRWMSHIAVTPLSVAVPITASNRQRQPTTDTHENAHDILAQFAALASAHTTTSRSSSMPSAETTVDSSLESNGTSVVVSLDEAPAGVVPGTPTSTEEAEIGVNNKTAETNAEKDDASVLVMPTSPISDAGQAQFSPATQRDFTAQIDEQPEAVQSVTDMAEDTAMESAHQNGIESTVMDVDPQAETVAAASSVSADVLDKEIDTQVANPDASSNCADEAAMEAVPQEPIASSSNAAPDIMDIASQSAPVVIESIDVISVAPQQPAKKIFQNRTFEQIIASLDEQDERRIRFNALTENAPLRKNILSIYKIAQDCKMGHGASKIAFLFLKDIRLDEAQIEQFVQILQILASEAPKVLQTAGAITVEDLFDSMVPNEQVSAEIIKARHSKLIKIFELIGKIMTFDHLDFLLEVKEPTDVQSLINALDFLKAQENLTADAVTALFVHAKNLYNDKKDWGILREQLERGEIALASSPTDELPARARKSAQTETTPKRKRRFEEVAAEKATLPRDTQIPRVVKATPRQRPMIVLSPVAPVSMPATSEAAVAPTIAGSNVTPRVKLARLAEERRKKRPDTIDTLPPVRRQRPAQPEALVESASSAAPVREVNPVKLSARISQWATQVADKKSVLAFVVVLFTKMMAALQTRGYNRPLIVNTPDALNRAQVNFQTAHTADQFDAITKTLRQEITDLHFNKGDNQALVEGVTDEFIKMVEKAAKALRIDQTNPSSQISAETAIQYRQIRNDMQIEIELIRKKYCREPLGQDGNPKQVQTLLDYWAAIAEKLAPISEELSVTTQDLAFLKFATAAMLAVTQAFKENGRVKKLDTGVLEAFFKKLLQLDEVAMQLLPEEAAEAMQATATASVAAPAEEAASSVTPNVVTEPTISNTPVTTTEDMDATISPASETDPEPASSAAAPVAMEATPSAATVTAPSETQATAANVATVTASVPVAVETAPNSAAITQPAALDAIPLPPGVHITADTSPAVLPTPSIMNGQLLNTALTTIYSVADTIKHPNLPFIVDQLNTILVQHGLMEYARGEVALAEDTVAILCNEIFKAFEFYKAQKLIVPSLRTILTSFGKPIPPAYQSKPLFLRLASNSASLSDTAMGAALDAGDAVLAMAATAAPALQFAATITGRNEMQGLQTAGPSQTTSNRLELR